MTNLRATTWVSAILAGFFWVSHAWAASSPLTAKEVELWIASYTTVDAWGNEHEEQIEQHEDENLDVVTTAEEMVKPIKAAGLYEEANSLVKKEGFKSLEHWADVTLRLLNASLAIAIEQQTGKPSDDAPAADIKLVKKYEAQIRKAREDAERAEEAREAQEQPEEEFEEEYAE